MVGLASYCAQGAREIGDVAQFKRRLGQALALDQTNQEATSLMYDSLVARRPDPLKLGMGLMWRVRAEPLDPAPRRALAELLLSQGAYAQAAQHFAAAQLGARSRLDDQFYHDWAQSLAATGVFPHGTLPLIYWGCRFGSLAVAVRFIAESFEDRTRLQVHLAPIIALPVLMFVLVFIGTSVLALFLPLIGLVETLS